MSALPVQTIINRLHGAGLSLSLAPSGGLAVAPASCLTPDLRDLIRGSKDVLLDWLTAANDSAAEPEPPENPVDWHELDAAYLVHHVNCKTCIAAGRGNRYGLRCGTGTALWLAYSEANTHPFHKPKTRA